MHVLFPNTQDLIQQGPGAMMCHGIVTENNANCSHTTQRNRFSHISYISPQHHMIVPITVSVPPRKPVLESLINLFAVPFLAGYLYGP